MNLKTHLNNISRPKQPVKIEDVNFCIARAGGTFAIRKLFERSGFELKASHIAGWRKLGYVPFKWIALIERVMADNPKSNLKYLLNRVGTPRVKPPLKNASDYPNQDLYNFVKKRYGGVRGLCRHAKTEWEDHLYPSQVYAWFRNGVVPKNNLLNIYSDARMSGYDPWKVCGRNLKDELYVKSAPKTPSLEDLIGE